MPVMTLGRGMLPDSDGLGQESESVCDTSIRSAPPKPSSFHRVAGSPCRTPRRSMIRGGSPSILALQAGSDVGSPTGSSSVLPPQGLYHRSTSPAFPRAGTISGSPRLRGRSSDQRSCVTTGSVQESANVRVMVRVRPFSDKEVQETLQAGGYMQSVVDMPRSDQALLLDHDKDYSVVQGFHFDHVFWSCRQQSCPVGYADQEQVYNVTGRQALAAAWDGINSCIFAYGQTGSGKTYTMMGDPAQICNEDGCDEESIGVIPRLCRELYDQLDSRDEHARAAGIQRTSQVEVRFLEIYNEKVKDLLVDQNHRDDYYLYQLSKGAASRPRDPDDLKVREHPLHGPYVEGISTYVPKTYADLMSLVNAGNQARATAETKMNDRSSRSHAMFRITVTQTTVLREDSVGIGQREAMSSQRRSNINLVDLAGSENVKRSGAQGSVLAEAQHINLSLTTLRRVIDALIEGRPKGQVPYRESILTWLLRMDLGGNAKTFMLATVSPHHSNQFESQRTLQYAMRARMIVNTLRINDDETAALIARLERQMEEKAAELATVSQEERGRLEEEKAQITAAVDELNDRLRRTTAEVQDYKARLEEENQKHLEEMMQSTVLLGATRARLQQEQSGAARLQAELDDIREQASIAGHSNVGDLAKSLVMERERARELLRERDEVEQREHEMASLHEQLRGQLHHVEADRDTTKRRVRDMEETHARLVERHQQETGQLRETMKTHCEELIRRNTEHTAALRECHDREVRQIIAESDAVVREQRLRAKEDRAASHKKYEELEGTLRTQLRKREDEHTRSVRRLQADVLFRDTRVGQLQQELERSRAEKADLAERLEQAVAELDSAKVGLAAAQKAADLDRNRALAAVESEREGERRMWREWQAAVAAELDRRERETQQSAASVRRVGQSVDKLERALTDASDLIDALGGGELPAHWTLDDVRRELTKLCHWRRTYISVRPDRERLRCQASTEPSAERDRLRLMLTRDPQPTDAAPAAVLDGLRSIPEISSPRDRSPRHHSRRRGSDNVHSAADALPYDTDPRPVAEDLTPLRQRMRPRGAGRRSRSQPQPVPRGDGVAPPPPRALSRRVRAAAPRPLSGVRGAASRSRSADAAPLVSARGRNSTSSTHTRASSRSKTASVRSRSRESPRSKDPRRPA